MSTGKRNQTAQKRTSAAIPSRFTTYGLPPDFPIIAYAAWTPPEAPIRTLHFHDCLEVGFCREGKGIVMVGDDVLPFARGDVCVIRRREVHFFRSDPRSPATWSFVFLDPERLLSRTVEEFGLLDASLLGRPNLPPLLSGAAHPQVASCVREIIDEVLAMGVRPCRDRRDAARALAVLMLTRLNRLRTSAVAGHDLSPALFQRLKPALETVTSRWREGLRVPALAEQCGMGARHFDRCFRKVTGRRPLDYITRLRVAMACGELASTDKTVLGVALDNGFGSVSNFNKSFRRVTGAAPAKWRESMAR